MNLQLDSNHSIFVNAPEVQEYFKEFAKREELSYFQFARFYNDGSMLGLLNRVDLFQKFLDLGWYSFSALREEDKSKCSYSFFWDEDLPEEPVSLARSHCSIYQGMTIVRRAPNYYDMIGFGRDTPCSSPGGYYLTRLRALEDFALSFEGAFKTILKNPAPHLIMPPSHQQDPNGPLICLGNRNIPIRGSQGHTHVTPRESECLQLWARHLTLKEIANYLDISPRTVETLLDRCRTRTGLTLPQLSRILVMCP
jgi:DNA-binding CsgD family transcriptional regulator